MPLDLWSTDLGAACEVERVNDPQHLLEDMASLSLEVVCEIESMTFLGSRHKAKTTSLFHYPLHPSAARASAKLRPVVVG